MPLGKKNPFVNLCIQCRIEFNVLLAPQSTRRVISRKGKEREGKGREGEWVLWKINHWLQPAN